MYNNPVGDTAEGELKGCLCQHYCFLTIDFDILFDDSENASVSVWMVIQAMVKDN